MDRVLRLSKYVRCVSSVSPLSDISSKRKRASEVHSAKRKRNQKIKIKSNHSPRIKITTCLHHPGSPSIAINNAPRSGRVNACAHACGVNPFFIPPGVTSSPCDSLATNLARNSRQSTFSRAGGGPSSFAASPSARATIEDCRRGFECTF